MGVIGIRARFRIWLAVRSGAGTVKILSQIDLAVSGPVLF